ncbi:UNVERIFIED_CONTAM: hypothetical protein NCL1_01297 [Trichonephila clavipes]
MRNLPARPGAPADRGERHERGQVRGPACRRRGERGGMARAPESGGVPGLPPERYRARLHRRVLELRGRWHLCLPLLRWRAVRRRHQVRLRLGLAELLAADDRRGRGRAPRHQPWHDPDGDHLPALRRASGPCLSRRPAPDRPALLRQFGIAAPAAERLIFRAPGRPRRRCAQPDEQGEENDRHL